MSARNNGDTLGWWLAKVRGAAVAQPVRGTHIRVGLPLVEEACHGFHSPGAESWPSGRRTKRARPRRPSRRGTRFTSEDRATCDPSCDASGKGRTEAQAGEVSNVWAERNVKRRGAVSSLSAALARAGRGFLRGRAHASVGKRENGDPGGRRTESTDQWVDGWDAMAWKLLRESGLQPSPSGSVVEWTSSVDPTGDWPERGIGGLGR